MSFSPFDQDPQGVPPEPTGNRDYPMEAPKPSAVRDRVTPPAIFLIVVGALNLLSSAYLAFNGVSLASASDEQYEKMMRQVYNEKQIAELEKGGYSIPQMKQLSTQAAFGFSGVGLLACVLIILGGVRMLMMKSYGLAVLASIIAAVPCVSGSACCCLGEAAGIWALIVLLSSEVREAFR
jgi:hypothetical protein